MVKGKLVLQGTIELLSPSCIGSGRKDCTEIDVLLDGAGRPFIPATSLVGVLKHSIGKNAILEDKNALKKFWGFISKEDGEISATEKEQQSSLCCSDLYCMESDPKIAVRDGIRIDTTKGIVVNGAKYDYQVVERGTRFKMHLEVSITDINREFSRQMVATIREVLEQGHIHIGAKTNSGLGKMKLTNAHVYEFDFSKKGDVLRWLKKDFSTPNPFSEKPFEITKNLFSIKAIFRLKSSFISRSYSVDPKVPDAVSIKSGDDFIIPGTSLKGAMRSRAERILHTIFHKDSKKPESIINELFGNVDDKNRSKNSYKGRISIDEVLLPKYSVELQTRIKIDRFTGGTIETALFETMPLFSDVDDMKHFCVNITIRDYKDHEAGLLLLILKDLWTGDLAVGGEKGIGRGVLKGQKATISWNTKIVTLDENISETSNDMKEALQRFVNALVNYEKGVCPHA
ncbi:MAG: RAMP superfamily CRISPR-associated protein [Candidatus Brocadia sp.]